jgi:hypothetical protein
VASMFKRIASVLGVLGCVVGTIGLAIGQEQRGLPLKPLVLSHVTVIDVAAGRIAGDDCNHHRRPHRGSRPIW